VEVGAEAVGQQRLRRLELVGRVIERGCYKEGPLVVLGHPGVKLLPGERTSRGDIALGDVRHGHDVEKPGELMLSKHRRLSARRHGDGTAGGACLVKGAPRLRRIKLSQPRDEVVFLPVAWYPIRGALLTQNEHSAVGERWLANSVTARERLRVGAALVAGENRRSCSSTSGGNAIWVRGRAGGGGGEGRDTGLGTPDGVHSGTVRGVDGVQTGQNHRNKGD